jgi:hypothetical protein
LSFDIRPHNIAQYSKCPRKAQKSWNKQSQLSLNGKIIATVIKQGFIYRARTSQIALWKKFISWINTEIERTIPENLNQASYKENKDILIRLSHWYNEYYIPKYNDPGLINIPIIKPVGIRFLFKDSIDIVSLDKKIRMYDFVEVADESIHKTWGTHPRDIYNDLSVHARLWGFRSISDLIPDSYTRIVIYPKTIRVLEWKIQKEALERTKKIIEYILDGISKGIYYPSISEQCIKCNYSTECSI